MVRMIDYEKDTGSTKGNPDCQGSRYHDRIKGCQENKQVQRHQLSKKLLSKE